MRRALFVVLVTVILSGIAAPGYSATYYVAPSSTDCSPSSPGAGTLANPWTNLYYALTRSLVAGDVLVLRGGTYRNQYDGFTNQCNLGLAKTVMPLIRAGTAASPIIIQNYPGEHVVIDGTDADVETATWTACGTNAWQLSSTDWKTASARTAQAWANPTGPGDPGVRLAWRDGSCSQLQAGEFGIASAGAGIYVRLPNNSNANNADIRVSCEAGDCAEYPILADAGANYITVRKNAAGGSFTVKYGRYNLFVDNNAQNLTFDGIDWVGAGTRDYGSCVRVYDGDFVTVKNGVCTEAMGEGIQFYGGGPGGSNGDGIQTSNNVVENMDVSLSGRAWVDRGWLGNNLGMSIIIKNCNNCVARGNRVRDAYGSAISVTTSENSGMRSNNVIVENNTIWNYGYLNSSAGGRTVAGIQYEPQTTGGITGGIIRNNEIYNGMATHGQWDEGIHASSAGYTPITGLSIVNNSLNNIGGPCINLRQNPAASTIRNNATNNCSTKGATCNGGGRCNLFVGSDSHVHTNNTYWASTSGAIVVMTTGTSYTRGNVQGSYESSAVQFDPLFRLTPDLRLQPTSSLIDAGTATDCPSVDHDGIPRPIGARCDVGAFEGTGTGVRPPFPPTNVRILP